MTKRNTYYLLPLVLRLFVNRLDWIGFFTVCFVQTWALGAADTYGERSQRARAQRAPTLPPPPLPPAGEGAPPQVQQFRGPGFDSSRFSAVSLSSHLGNKCTQKIIKIIDSSCCRYRSLLIPWTDWTWNRNKRVSPINCSIFVGVALV